MPAEATICTRFAPSPSGHLHVGGARTALFCWAFARARSGRFILRIEDTDRKRSSDAAGLAFLEDLRWLGLDWDEGPAHEGSGGGEHGPYRQSERRAIYAAHVDRLLAEGRAYRAFETPEELEEARATARARNESFRYDRAALGLDRATVDRYLAEGRPHVIRFRLPDDEDEVVVHDVVFGEVRVKTSEMDDFVIVKADGFPTYHFAVVVDDELMGITHVIRGQEHLYNTPRHVLLQRALGFRTPTYAHISLIFNPDGSKMSKRDKDKTLRKVVRERGLDGCPGIDADAWSWWLESDDHQLDLETSRRLADTLRVDLPEINVEDFRRAGYLPSVVMNYLALLGWSPGDDVEQFDRAFLLERFDLDRVIRSPARFDRDKLLAFNLDALQAMSTGAFVEAFEAHVRRYHPEFLEMLSAEQFERLAAANHARSKTLEDSIASCRFFIVPDDEIVYEQSKAVRKALVKGSPNGFDHLEALAPRLRALTEWTEPGLERTIRDYAEAEAAGQLGKVAQPLRVAVSGGTVSPAIFDTLLVLGQTTVLNRIERCLARRETLSMTA